MLRQALILKVFQGASRSRRDCGNREAALLTGGRSSAWDDDNNSAFFKFAEDQGQIRM